MQFTYGDLRPLADSLARTIIRLGVNRPIITFNRGGLDTTALVCRSLSHKPTVIGIDPEQIVNGYYFTREVKPIIVDDLLDTGATYQKVLRVFPGVSDIPYLVLFDKQTEKRVATPPNLFAAQTIHSEDWIVFPWEDNS